MVDPTTTRHIVGVMTGTSIDGIDAALVRIDGAGLDMTARCISLRSAELGALQGVLRDAAAQKPMTAGEFASLAWQFGELHAAVIARLIDGHPSVDLIVAHGQTVYHKPPVSWQLVNPAPIEAMHGCPVICDLRQSDLARGGEGAPITPLADWIMFRSADESRAIVNLGGFANATILPRDDGGHSIADIRAFDIGACNHVLNAVAMRAFGVSFDRDGAHAAAGTPNEQAAALLFSGVNVREEPRRSLGTGDERLAWVDQHANVLAPNDLAATAVRGIAMHIASTLMAISKPIDEVLLAGGGARNKTLVQDISARMNVPVRMTNDHGFPVEAREAAAMAVLGALRVDGVPVTLSDVTGRSERD